VATPFLLTEFSKSALLRGGKEFSRFEIEVLQLFLAGRRMDR